jgi:hypothetical protein
MATSENTVLVSFNVQLRSKQIVLWTILPVDRVNTIVGKFEYLFFLKKYGAAAIFFLYGNKNVPSAEILRRRHCLITRTFILFGLTNQIRSFKLIKNGQLKETGNISYTRHKTKSKKQKYTAQHNMSWTPLYAM